MTIMVAWDVKQQTKNPSSDILVVYKSFCLFRLCCVSTSPDRELISAGFEDGSTKIWRLVPGLFSSVKDTSSPSMIYLSADYLESDGEDNRSDER